MLREEGEGLERRGDAGTNTAVFYVNWRKIARGPGGACAAVAHLQWNQGLPLFAGEFAPLPSPCNMYSVDFSGDLFVQVLPQQFMTGVSSQ